MKICKHCGTELVIKQTQKKATQLKQPYYYSAYYFCPNCQRIYHDDKFKVINEISDSPILFDSDSSFPTTSKFSKVGDGNEKNAGVEIWTDGACTNNGTEKAKAAWAFVSGKHEKAGLVDGKQTNNRGEALAIYHALKWASEEGFKIIKIHTDSQISIFGVMKHFSKVKMNQEIFRDIADVISENQLEVTFKKVLGHSGDENNERVDKLANGLASA